VILSLVYGVDVGAGAYLKEDRYFLSLSVTKLLSLERLHQRDGNAFFSEGDIHAYFSGG